MSENPQQAIERNYAWFLGQLSTLLPDQQGRYALIHDQHLIGLFDTPEEAERQGELQFPNAIYSIQPVEDYAIEMGYFAYALH